MSKNIRWIYRSTDADALIGLDDLEMLGYHSRNSTYKLDFHTHHQAYEFVYIEKGKSTWEVDGVYYTTHAGDLFFTKPGALHRGRYDVMEPCQLWWMLLNAPAQQAQETWSWLKCSLEESCSLQHQLEQLPRITHLGTRFAEHFSKLKEAIEQRDALSNLKVRNVLLTILFALFEQASMSTQKQNTAELTQVMKTTLARDWTWRPRVDEIAEKLGYSPSHFFKLFREQSGLSPISYMERLRIDEACQTLQLTDDKITDISNRLGYATSQHFATSFIRHTGYTPSAWRAKYKSARE